MTFYPKTRVFRCPKCKEVIADDAQTCRFCETSIDPATVENAVDALTEENRRFRRTRYAKHIRIGIVVFVLGVFIAVGSAMLTSMMNTDFIVIFYGVMLAGATDFFYGLVGWFQELKKK